MSTAVDPQTTDQQQVAPFRSAVAEKIAAYYEDPARLADLTHKQELFLQGMRETGVVLRACERADISSPTAYQWRAMYPEFRIAWDYAKNEANDKVRSSLFNMAVSEKNIVATIYWLKNNCPEYKDRVQVDVQAMQSEIEERLSALSEQMAVTTADSPATLNAKSIIDEVIRGPLSLPATTASNDHHE